MAKLIERSQALMLIAVVFSLLTSTFTLLWGALKAVEVIGMIVTSYGESPFIIFHLVEVLDTFLIAIVLFIFGVSVYELFVGSVACPGWMVVDTLAELKARLSSVLILVMAVRFLERLLRWDNPQDVLLFAVSITLVSGVLIAFNRFGEDSSKSTIEPG